MSNTIQKNFSRTKGPMTLWLSMWHWNLRHIIVCSNDDPRLTLNYFTARSNLVSYAFVWGELLESHLMEKNLQQMTRGTKGLCLYKSSEHKGLAVPAPGLRTCTCIKT